jgi:type IV secretion system protein VirB8
MIRRSVMSEEAMLETYFAEAASWDRDRQQRIERSERRAWWAAAAGWVCAIAAVSTVALLTPLKTVEPYVIRVDRSTGIVDVVPAFAGESAVDESVTRYFLARYIRVCEGFSYATAESDYAECGAFNTSRRNQELYALWQVGNPQSPLNLYKDGSALRVQVSSITFFKRKAEEGLAQVRFVLAKRRGGGASDQLSQWIATLQYVYGTPSKDALSRQWNPFGLRILDYRREPEVVTPTSSETRRTQLLGQAGSP